MIRKLINNVDDNNDRIERGNSRFLQSPHCATNYLQHIRSRGPGEIVCKSRATHRALTTCNILCATWYEWTAQLLSLTEFKSHSFQISLFLFWLNHYPMKEGRKSEYPEKNPYGELKKMPHTKARKFKPQLSLEPAL